MDFPKHSAQNSIRSRAMKSLAITLLMIIGGAISITAETLFQRPALSTAQGLFSNELGQKGIDSFSLSKGVSVTQITWYGFYKTDLEKNIRRLRFTVKVMLDSPGSKPLLDRTFDATVKVTGMKTNRIPSFSGRAIYQFDANLNKPLALAAGTTYWISIYDVDGATGEWLWADTEPSGPTLSRHFAFTLEGS